MASLTQQQLAEIHTAIVSANLDGSRDALLANVNKAFSARLGRENNLAAQIWIDLTTMNDVGYLSDESCPLIVWLDTATQLSGARRESTTFRAFAKLVRRAPTEPSLLFDKVEPRHFDLTPLFEAYIDALTEPANGSLFGFVLRGEERCARYLCDRLIAERASDVSWLMPLGKLDARLDERVDRFIAKLEGAVARPGPGGQIAWGVASSVELATRFWQRASDRFGASAGLKRPLVVVLAMEPALQVPPGMIELPTPSFSRGHARVYGAEVAKAVGAADLVGLRDFVVEQLFEKCSTDGRTLLVDRVYDFLERMKDLAGQQQQEAITLEDLQDTVDMWSY